jgi:hypothetical protein
VYVCMCACVHVCMFRFLSSFIMLCFGMQRVVCVVCVVYRATQRGGCCGGCCSVGVIFCFGVGLGVQRAAYVVYS